MCGIRTGIDWAGNGARNRTWNWPLKLRQLRRKSGGGWCDCRSLGGADHLHAWPFGGHQIESQKSNERSADARPLREPLQAEAQGVAARAGNSAGLSQLIRARHHEIAPPCRAHLVVPIEKERKIIYKRVEDFPWSIRYPFIYHN